MRRASWVLVGAVLALAMGTGEGDGAAPPVPRPHQPTAEELTQLRAAHARMQAAAGDGDFAAAARWAGAVLAQRRRLQWGHWQVTDARAEVERWRRLAGQPAAARKKVARALALLEKAGVARARHDLVAEEKAHREALALFRDALGDSHPETASGYNFLGLTLEVQGRYPQAQAQYEKALAIWRGALGERHPLTALGYANLGVNQHYQARYARAQALLEKALAIRRLALGAGHPDTARSFNHLAVCLSAQGQHARAHALYQQALALHRAVLGEEDPETAACYNGLAHNLRAMGQLAPVQPLYARALAIWRKTLGEEHFYTAIGYGNLASVLQAQGKSAEAQPLFEKALAISRKVQGERHPATARNGSNLAVNLSDQGKNAEAQPLFEKALAVNRAALGDDHPDTALACNNLAACLARQGAPEQAASLYRKALASYRRTRGERSAEVVLCLNNLADSSHTAGRDAEAQRLLQHALAIRLEVQGARHPATALACANLANVLTAQGQYAPARRLLEKAVAVSRAVLGDEHPLTALWCNQLGINLWQLGLRRQAARLWQASLPGQEIGRVQGSASGFGRAVADWRAGLPTHSALAVAFARLGQPLAAFRHAEAHLARGLLDDLDPASPEASALAALQARLRRVEAALPGLYGRQDLSPDQRKLRDGLAREHRRLLGRLASLAAEASARRVLPLARIQKALPADAALVLWVEAPALGECWGCVLRRAGPPRWERLPGTGPGGAWGQADLGRLARLFNALHDPDESGRAEVGPAERGRLVDAVRRQCLAPLEKHLGAAGRLPAVRRLLVAAGGSPGVLPLEVLAGRRVVSYVPSGSVLARLMERHRPLAPTALVALGDPAFSPAERAPLVRRRGGHLALPGTRLEVEALAGLVGKGRATVLLGSHASEQELDRLQAGGVLGKARIIHLATHGEIDLARPERSRLILAQDRLPDPAAQAGRGGRILTGELTVAAIRARWRLDADLVVLSACRSGLGRVSGGEGPLGFAHAFLQKGAHGVVLSRWKVDDTATALLMVRFYEDLLGKRKGLEKPLGRAAALDEAKRWLRGLSREEAEGLAAHLTRGTLRGTVARLKPPDRTTLPHLPGGGRPFAHPRYWAAFVLVGDPD